MPRAIPTEIQPAERHEKRLLSMPGAWWRAVQRAAQARGETVTSWIRRAIRRALPPEEREKLPEPNPRGGGRKAD